MIKFYYPDGDTCYRALHTVHAVFNNPEGKLIGRALRPDNGELYEFEITAFEVVEAGVRCD